MLLLPAKTPLHIDELTNRVHCMDALELLKRLPDNSIDLVLTDPPYGLAGRIFDFPHKHYSAINELWDYEAPITWMAECRRVLKPTGTVICFGVRQSIYKFAAEGLRLGWKLINDITWVKPDAPPCFTGRNLTEATERALWFSPSGTNWFYDLNRAKHLNGGINYRDVWVFGIERNQRVHPAQKPLELIERCIELFAPPGSIVCDPFCGSGTTGLAARNTGRRFIMGDTSPEYCEIARERLKTEFGSRKQKPGESLDDLPLFRGDRLYAPAGA